MQALLEVLTDPLATITEGQGEDGTEDTDSCPQVIDEPEPRRQRRMEWEETARFPSKEQWQLSLGNEGQFATHSNKHTTRGVVKILRCVYGKKMG